MVEVHLSLPAHRVEGSPGGIVIDAVACGRFESVNKLPTYLPLFRLFRLLACLDTYAPVYWHTATGVRRPDVRLTP